MSDPVQRRRDILARVALRRDDLVVAWTGMALSAESAEVRVRHGIRIARAVSGVLAVAAVARAAVGAFRGRPRPMPKGSAMHRWPRIVALAAQALRYLK